jgi:hypothetical protein
MEWVANDEIESSCLSESWKRPIDKIGIKLKKKTFEAIFIFIQFWDFP